MFVKTFRDFWISLLIFTARLIYFLESKTFDYLMKVFLFLLCAVYAFSKFGAVKAYISHLNNNIKVYKWYITLPSDYLLEKERALDASYEEYKKSLKPKPPALVRDIPPPLLSAKSYVVLDVPSGEILLSKSSTDFFPPASTAKLATALAALKIYSLDEIIDIPQFCTQIASSKANFMPGQKFMVGDLIKALLIGSSGDAACALSIGKTSYADFVNLMNDISNQAGLKHTNFTNPIGLDDFDGGNFTTAYDLALLSAFAMENDFIKETVKTWEFQIKDIEGKFARNIVNTNKLISELPGSVGIKTGTTLGAGEVLSYAYAKDGINLIIVVMASQDRFEDVKKILNWTLSSYSWPAGNM